MKKSLSLFLALAMVFSMFASVAFAAETTTTTTPKTAEEKYEALKALGIFEGDDTGANLQGEMDRAQLAKIVAKLKGLTEDKTANTYSDVPADHWAAGYIGAVTKAKIFDGVAEGKFDPAGKVTLEQLAKVLVVTAGLTESTDKVDGQVSDWAKGYVAAAVKALGLKAENYTVNAIRGVFVELTYGALDVLTPAPAQDASLAAIGAKKLEVKFAAAIDSSKATFEVKKGAGVVNVSTKTVSEDKKGVVLETTSALTEGDYTVTVKGVFEKDKALTVKVENEKVAKIDLLSDSAAAVFNAGGTAITSATISYKIFNQYNEDITSKDQANWTTTLGTVSPNKGVLTITYPFVKDQTFVITGFNGTVVTTKQVKVGDKSVVSSVTVKSLYNKDAKELKTNSDFTTYYLLLEAKDQYGTAVKAAQLINDVRVYSTNPTVVDVTYANFKDGQGPNSDQVALQLSKPQGFDAGNNYDGKASVNFVPIYGGTQSSFEVAVTKAAIVDSITLSQPAATVGVGDVADIPFTAVDQFGNAITKYSDLNGKVSLGTGLTWDQDYYTGEAKLKFNATTKGINVLIVTAPKTAKTSTVQVDVKDAKVPTSVAAVKDLKTALAFVNGHGAQTAVDADNIVIYDQYGLEVSQDNFYNAGYTIRASVDDNTELALDGGLTANILNKDDNFTVTALAKGDQKILFQIVKAGVVQTDLEALETTFKVVNKDDIKDYAVADVPKVWNGNADHNVDVDVTGLLSDGSKVVLPVEQYSVSATVYGVAVSGKTIDATGVSFTGTTDTEKKGLVNVAIDGKDNIIQKDLIVTNVAPAVATISIAATTLVDVKDGVALVAAADATPANLIGIFSAKDQYGKTITIATPYFTFTNISDADTASKLAVTNGFVTGTAAIANAATGDSFTLILNTQNGIYSTVKVKIK